MLKKIRSIPWKRIMTVAVPMFGAWEALPVESQTLRAAGSILIAGLSGLGINAEKYLAKRNTPANPFDSAAVREKLDRESGK